jgi:hypothetical protein
MFTSDSVGILLSFFGTAFFDESNITSFLQYALALQYGERSAVLMAVLMEGFGEPSDVLMEGFGEPSDVLMEGVLRCGVLVEEEGRW